MVLPARRDMAFAHGLQQRRLRLGRRAVDLVSQHQIRKNRPGDKSETPAAAVAVLVHHFRAKNVSRHQIRRELDALEAQREKLRNALGEMYIPFLQKMISLRMSGRVFVKIKMYISFNSHARKGRDSR